MQAYVGRSHKGEAAGIGRHAGGGVYACMAGIWHTHYSPSLLCFTLPCQSVRLYPCLVLKSPQSKTACHAIIFIVCPPE